MDGASGTGSNGAEDSWVDSVVAKMALVEDSTLALLDLTKSLDELLGHVLGSDMPDKVVPLRRRRISRRTGAVAVLAVIAVGGASAAAVKGGALTGLFGTPGSTEMDTSEYVNIAAPSFPSWLINWAINFRQRGFDLHRISARTKWWI
jgi:hypothetical protein